MSDRGTVHGHIEQTDLPQYPEPPARNAKRPAPRPEIRNDVHFDPPATDGGARQREPADQVGLIGGGRFSLLRPAASDPLQP